MKKLEEEMKKLNKGMKKLEGEMKKLNKGMKKLNKEMKKLNKTKEGELEEQFEWLLHL